MNADTHLQRAFHGRSVIITGAGSGIGRAMVTALSRHGARILALDVDGRNLESLAAETAAHTAQVDVRDRQAVHQAISSFAATQGGIDYLFNNAGVTLLGEAQSIPFDRWKWLLDINLMGVIHGIQAAYPIMIAQGSGMIVNTASVAGRTGYATAAAYTASKSAVLELTRSLAAEARRKGVRIAAACPGYVNSGIFSDERIVGANRTSVVNDLPVKMMSPEEAATGLLLGAAKGKDLIVFPFSARFLWHLASWIPFTMAPFQRRFIRLFRSQQRPGNVPPP
jgi:NADP-dependent 3-hydroxy acid dehydrogenase YdfG